MSSFIHPRLGTVSLAVPLGKGRFRLYVGRHKRDGAPKERAWSGNDSVDAFSSANVAAGARPLGMPAISAPLVRWPRSMPPTAGSSIPTVGDNEGKPTSRRRHMAAGSINGFAKPYDAGNARRFTVANGQPC